MVSVLNVFDLEPLVHLCGSVTLVAFVQLGYDYIP